MEVVNQVENKLLGRKELNLKIPGNGKAMSRDQIRSEIAKKNKAKEENIVIDNIKSHFGSRDLDVTAYIYENKEVSSKLTRKHMQKRNEIVVPEVPEEEVAAPAETETTEEKKEEE